MLRFRNRRGQIVIPAMFLLPTLFTFVFLIYETAKLSRIKIRHQFAVDAAAFVEMTNYSDFLNRSAYVNGAFPMRIFWEGFSETKLDCMGKDPCPGPTPLAEILYADGIYPRSVSIPNPNNFQSKADSGQPWDIQYNETGSSPGAMRGKAMNQDDPNPSSSDCIVGAGVTTVSGASTTGGTGGSNQGGCVTIISMNTAKYWNINWEDANQIYKLYVQIYQLLGSVESAQFSVLQRLQTDHNFLTKSYWLNAGGDQAMSEAAGLKASWNQNSGAAKWSAGSEVTFHCVQNIMFHGNQLVRHWGQPYQIWASDPPPKAPDTIGECSGLFQVVTVKKSIVDGMRSKVASGFGWPVQTRYALDPSNPTHYENYFHVDLQNEMMSQDGGPKVHATIAIGGFGADPSVWRELNHTGPTPKFQVREYP